MAERIVTLDEAYRKQMAVDAEVHRDDISGDLLSFSKTLGRYIQDMDSILRMFKKKQREYNETYSEAYENARFKGELVMSEKDAAVVAKKDAAVVQKQEELDNIESDFNLLKDWIDLYKQRYWTIKSFIDFEKFKAGEID